MARTQSRFFTFLACGILLFIFGQTAWTAWLNKSPTFDEPLHLVAAWMQAQEGDFRCDPDNPSLWKYYVAIGWDRSLMKMNQQSSQWAGMLRGVDDDGPFAADTLFHTPGNNADSLIRGARGRMIMLAVLLGGIIAWWAWELRGPPAAVAACLAFSLDPNFLAHGALVKNDVPISLIFTALMFSVWKLGDRATAARWLAMSLLLGAALTTKFSGILAVPIVSAALLARTVMPRPWHVLRWSAITGLQRLWASGVLAICTILFVYGFIWACYGFRFGPSAQPNELFDSADSIELARHNDSFAIHGGPLAIDEKTLAQWEQQWHPTLPVRMFEWAERHRALPQSWLMGSLVQYAKSLIRPGFLLGDRKMLGWWCYFPLTMLFKTPLATLGGLAICVAALVYRVIVEGRSAASRISFRAAWVFCCMVLPPILYMGSAMTSPINLGIRHILPVYPFLFLFLGVMAAWANKRWPRAAVSATVIFVLGLAVETASAYPNFIPFFNVAARLSVPQLIAGPIGAFPSGAGLLSDSNIDWGQELQDLADWQQKHRDRQLYLCYFGSADPRYYGLRYVKMPGGFGPADEEPSPGARPVYAISIVALQQTFLVSQSSMDYLAQFRQQHPAEVLGGGSIYLYYAP